MPSVKYGDFGVYSAWWVAVISRVCTSLGKSVMLSHSCSMPPKVSDFACQSFKIFGSKLIIWKKPLHNKIDLWNLLCKKASKNIYRQPNICYAIFAIWTFAMYMQVNARRKMDAHYTPIRSWYQLKSRSATFSNSNIFWWTDLTRG